MTIAGLLGVRVAADREYPVTPRLVAAFADAIGETDPVCHNRGAAEEAGFTDVVAPPGLFYLMTYPLSSELMHEVGVRPNRIVHAAESYRLLRPITAGDALTAAAWVTGFRPGPAEMRVLTWRARLTDATGRPAGDATTSVLIRPTEKWPAHLEPAVFQPPLGATLDRFAITRGHVARYCGVSGDAHPVHWSDLVARRCGLNQVIMHSSLLLAVVGRAAASAAGGVARVRELGARFTVPVEVPDDDSGCQLDVAACAPDPAGRVALEVGVAGARVLSQASTVISRR